MKYVFTDWDKRAYERETKKIITIFSTHEKNGKLSLCIKEGDLCFLRFQLSAKEAKAISLSLESSLNEIDSSISV